MAGNLVHFELPAEDTARAKAFWGSLFGWQFQAWEGPMEYNMVQGAQPGGAVYPKQGSESGPVIYFDTDDVAASAEKVQSLGGTVVTPKSPIPGVGYFAICQDTEGNAFGLFESDESVPAPGE